MISLAGGLPDADYFPTAELAEIARQVIADGGDQVLQYGVTQGDAGARSALASLFGGDVDDDRVMVTTGSQQALDLIARVVVNPGDQVVVGDPDYLGALQVFSSFGADIRAIGVGGDGLNTSQLENELQWGLRPKCCYVVPNFHNPTGVTMSDERRTHLNSLSQRYGFLIIEDDPYRELYYARRPPVDWVGDPDLTVSLRSVSKTLAPGLRVGAMAGPRWLIEPAVIAKQSADLHTSSLSQAIVSRALSAPWMPQHLMRLRSRYGDKRDTLTTALNAEFSNAVDFQTPDGGMFLWARFAHVKDTAVWLERCLDHGVCFVPGDAFSVSRDLPSCPRLSFATGTTTELGDAVVRMAQTLND